MRIGILGALEAELRPLLEELEEPRETARADLRVVAGHLDGRHLVLAAAGIGKANAAFAATLLCDAYACCALVVCGVAGAISADLVIGDLVVAARVVDGDYGRATDEGRVLYRPGAMPLPDVPPGEPAFVVEAGLERDVRATLPTISLPAVRLIPGSPARAPQVHLGTVVTTDAFVASEGVRDRLGRQTGAIAVEMEGAAVAQVAERFGVPWLIVRAVSDRAGTESGLDFQAFMAGASGSACTLVRVLLPATAAAVAPRTSAIARSTSAGSGSTASR